MLSEEKQKELMRLALEEARMAAARGDEPFGAVLCDAGGRVIASAGNSENTLGDPTAHAEVVLIRRACAQLKTKDLSGMAVVASAECCPMCASALTLAGVREFYTGAPMEGFCNPWLPLREVLARTVWETELREGVLAEECAAFEAAARREKEAADLSVKYG